MNREVWELKQATSPACWADHTKAPKVQPSHGEVNLWVKSLLQKHKNLTSDPQNVGDRSMEPSTGGVETGWSLDLTLWPAGKASQRAPASVRDSASRTKMESDGGGCPTFEDQLMTICDNSIDCINLLGNFFKKWHLYNVGLNRPQRKLLGTVTGTLSSKLIKHPHILLLIDQIEHTHTHT